MLPGMMKCLRTAVASLPVPAMLLLGATASAQTTYQIVQLQDPPGALAASALALNAAGEIAGRATIGQNFHPVTWTADGTATVLAIPPGYPGAAATGISDAGDVCGSAWSNGTFGMSAAVLWPGGGAPAYIPTFGGLHSAANGISPSGTVVGWAASSGDIKGQRAFRFTNGVLLNAGSIQGSAGAGSVGSAINASGQIVGNGRGETMRNQAMIDDPVEGMIGLGNLGGLDCDALAISAAGHVAGRAHTGAEHPQVEWLAISHAFLWYKGRMTDLGVLPGLVESQARGVNSDGVVVGRCTGAAFGSTPRAFVWKDGQMTDLNTLIPVGSGWTLQTANAINESGRIVGEGLIGGKSRAYVLIPNP